MTEPFAGLNTALAGQYIIDRELGRGGMALVYLARDAKHERFVALKTLRPEIAVALGGGRERFLREIKLAARLQHPNILPVYDSGDAAGSLYYVMPFVEGESLRERLEREPQLPLDDALQITREVADALAYAHDHDVVHRDIKPENIMLSGGHAIVTDFGIARAVSAAGGDKLTETGLAIGTPAYMPPEQSAGTGKVDRRSDIYSLACVLYETLAGQPPFTGPTAQAIMARHSLDSVPRLKVVREAIPDDVESVIERALEKVPADRYQTAVQFRDALSTASTGRISRVSKPRPSVVSSLRRRRPVAIAVGLVLLGAIAWVVGRGISGRRAGAANATGGLDPHRVAVPYFADLSADSSLGYLADGLTEALINQLRGVRALDVVSKNGVAPFRGQAVSRDSIAQALEAGTLVEGTVEAVGPRIRVTIRLVDGASGADVRRQSFEFAAGAPLAIRDSVAAQAALFLRERLGEEIRLREQRAATKSVEAWTLLQRAERYRKDAQRAARGNDRSGALALATRGDSLLQAAERGDPEWAEPVLLRGWMAWDVARFLTERPARAEALQRALGHAERALLLRGNSPDALELRGTVRYALWRVGGSTSPSAQAALAQQARQDLEDAVRGDPTLATAWEQLSLLHHSQNDIVSFVLTARNAYQADAYQRNADGILTRLFYGSYNIMQFAEARRWCGEGARRFPRDYRFVECQLMLLTTPDATADIGRAWSLARRIDSLAPERDRVQIRHREEMFVAGVIGRAGLKDSARHVLVRARADLAADPEQELLGYEAAMRVMIGDADTAVALLQRYIVANPQHSFEIGGDVHWWWRDLQRHPGFQTVLHGRR